MKVVMILKSPYSRLSETEIILTKAGCDMTYFDVGTYRILISVAELVVYLTMPNLLLCFTTGQGKMGRQLSQ